MATSPSTQRSTQGAKPNASNVRSKQIYAPSAQVKPKPLPSSSKIKRRLHATLIVLMLISPLMVGAILKWQWLQVATEPSPGFVVLDRVISSLGDDMKAQITLAIETPDKNSAEIIKLYTPKLRSMLFLTVAGFNSKELLTPQGKKHLANTLTEVFKKNVDPERSELILGVHYTEFVIAN